MKGIVLAGGYGTRLYPLTKILCKQLLPVYDKPMIYYPLSVLMLAGIREILIISTPQDIPAFKKLFGDGNQLGLSIQYARQQEPRGIAEAFIIGEEFIQEDRVCLILGDNIFYGHGLNLLLQKASALDEGAVIFCYTVKDPQRYGIVEFNQKKMAISIEEKPARPRSNWAVVGLYFYDNQVARYAKKLRPSARGELEITDINNAYLKNKKLKVELMGRGFAWLDTGTHQSLIDASGFIKTIEERQGLKIACIEEIAYQNQWIDKNQLATLARTMNNNDYGKYLFNIIGSDPEY
ncbi:MAG: glucose-1-phosphate thymidylyltransferase RfbA [Candidatus Aminicenantes bacterium]|nr:glucose-1-phosphate thymidylyltransferase RfbA [Candidatus Aminicenantes bacterium]